MADGCATAHNSGWWYLGSALCLSPKLMGDVNGTTTGNGIYWPGFPDPVLTEPQPLSKVVIRILHVLQAQTRKFVVQRCLFFC